MNHSTHQKNVVIIAMLDSSHTARWLEQFSNNAIHFILIPSTPHRRINTDIKKLLLNRNAATYSLSLFNRITALPFGILDVFLNNRIRSFFIHRQLSNIQDEISFIHVHEVQHAGYLLLQAIRSWSIKPKLVVNVWGSDLYWFQQFNQHAVRITALMELTNQLVCECLRDSEIARSLGYQGRTPITMPVSGGIAITKEVPLTNPPSMRKTILIKGYTGFVGRADVALRSIERLAPLLSQFNIVVYSSDLKCRRITRKIVRKTNLDIRCFRRRAFTQTQMNDLFRQSRVHIGVSESDGVPRSLLESMANGCFPIQTSTSCASEVFENGTEGFIIDFESDSDLDKSILRALNDDDLVNSAALRNVEIILEHRNFENVQSQAQSLYQAMWANS